MINLGNTYGNTDIDLLRAQLNRALGLGNVDEEGQPTSPWSVEYLGGGEVRSGGGRMDALPVRVRHRDYQDSITLELRNLGQSHIFGERGFGYSVGTGMYAETGYLWGQKTDRGTQIHDYGPHEALRNRLLLSFQKGQGGMFSSPDDTPQKFFIDSLTSGGRRRQDDNSWLTVAGRLAYVNPYEVGPQVATWAQAQAPVVMDHGVYDFSERLQQQLDAGSLLRDQYTGTNYTSSPVYYDAERKSVISPHAMDIYPLGDTFRPGANESRSAQGFSLHDPLKALKRASLLRRQTTWAMGGGEILQGQPIQHAAPGLNVWAQSSALQRNQQIVQEGMYMTAAVPRSGLFAYPGGGVLDTRRFQGGPVENFAFPFRAHTGQTLPLTQRDIANMIPLQGDPNLQLYDLQNQTFGVGETVTFGRYRPDAESDWINMTHQVANRPLTITEPTTLSLPVTTPQAELERIQATGINAIIRGETSGRGHHAAVVLQGMQHTDVSYKAFGKTFAQAWNYGADSPANTALLAGQETPIDLLTDIKTPEVALQQFIGGLSPERARAFVGEFIEGGMPGFDIGQRQQMNIVGAYGAFAGAEGPFELGRLAEQYQRASGRSMDLDMHTWFMSEVNNEQKNQRMLQEYGIGMLRDTWMNVGSFSPSERAQHERSLEQAMGYRQAAGDRSRASQHLRWQGDASGVSSLWQKDDWLVGGIVATGTPEYTGGAETAGLPVMQALHYGGYHTFAQETGMSLTLDPSQALSAGTRAWSHIAGTFAATKYQRPMENAFDIDQETAGDLYQIMRSMPESAKTDAQKLAYLADQYGEMAGEGYRPIHFGSNRYMPDPRAIRDDLELLTLTGDESISKQSTKYLGPLRAALGQYGAIGSNRHQSLAAAEPHIMGYNATWPQFERKSDLLKSLVGTTPSHAISGRYRGSRRVSTNQAVLSDDRLLALFGKTFGGKENLGQFKDWLSSQGGVSGVMFRDPILSMGSRDRPAGLPVNIISEDMFLADNPDLSPDSLFNQSGVTVSSLISEWSIGDEDADPFRLYSYLGGSGPKTWHGTKDMNLRDSVQAFSDPAHVANLLTQQRQERFGGVPFSTEAAWAGGSALTEQAMDILSAIEGRTIGDPGQFAAKGSSVALDDVQELVDANSGVMSARGTSYNNFLRALQASVSLGGGGDGFKLASAYNRAMMQYQPALDAKRGQTFPEMIYQTMSFKEGGDGGTLALSFKDHRNNWHTAKSPEQLRERLIDAYSGLDLMSDELLAAGFSTPGDQDSYGNILEKLQSIRSGLGDDFTPEQLSAARYKGLRGFEGIGNDSYFQRAHMTQALGKLDRTPDKFRPMQSFGGQSIEDLRFQYGPQVAAMHFLKRDTLSDPAMLAQAARMAGGQPMAANIDRFLRTAGFNPERLNPTLGAFRLRDGQVIAEGGGRGGDGGGNGINIPGSMLDPDDEGRYRRYEQVNRVLGVQQEGERDLRLLFDFSGQIKDPQQAAQVYEELLAARGGLNVELGQNINWFQNRLQQEGLMAPGIGDALADLSPADRFSALYQGAVGLAGSDPDKIGSLNRIMGSKRMRTQLSLSNRIVSAAKHMPSLRNMLHDSDHPGLTENMIDLESGSTADAARAGRTANQGLGASRERGEFLDERYIEARENLTKAMERTAEKFEEMQSASGLLNKRQATLEYQMAKTEENLERKILGATKLQARAGGVGEGEAAFMLEESQGILASADIERAQMGAIQAEMSELSGMSPAGYAASQLSQEMFGGWNLMYMQRVGGMVNKAMTIGDQEMFQREALRRQAGAMIMGSPETPYIDGNMRAQQAQRLAASGGMSNIAGLAADLGFGSMAADLGGAAVGGLGAYALASKFLPKVGTALGLGEGAIAGALGPIGWAAGTVMAGINMYGRGQRPVTTMGAAANAGVINRNWNALSAGLFMSDEDIDAVLMPGFERNTGFDRSASGSMARFRQSARALDSAVQGYLGGGGLGFSGLSNMQQAAYAAALEETDPFLALGDQAPMAALRAVVNPVTDANAFARAYQLTGEEGLGVLQQFGQQYGLGLQGRGDYNQLLSDLLGAPNLGEGDRDRLFATLTAGVGRQFMPTDATGIQNIERFVTGAYGGNFVDMTQAANTLAGMGVTDFGGGRTIQDRVMDSRYVQDSWSPLQRYTETRDLAAIGMRTDTMNAMAAAGAPMVSAQALAGFTDPTGRINANQLAGLASSRQALGLDVRYQGFGGTAGEVAFYNQQTQGAGSLVGRGFDGGMVANYMQQFGSISGLQLGMGLANLDPAMMAVQAWRATGGDMSQMDAFNAGGLALGQGSEIGSTFGSIGSMRVAEVGDRTVLAGRYRHGITSGEMDRIFGADWAANDPHGIRKTLQESGTFGLQQEQAKAQLAMAGIQGASAQLSFAFTTGVGLDAYKTVDPRTGRRFNIPAGGAWGIQDRQFDLSGRQQDYNFAYQEQQQGMQRSQFYENLGMQRQQTLAQRGWAMEDWAYQDQTRDMGWAWQQEDFQESVRFMTGRQRRLSERQMGRQTVMHNLESEQIDRQRERQEEVWGMEDERFQKTKDHFEEQAKLQDERLEKMKEFYEESRKLQEEQMQLSRAQFIESNRLQKAAASTFAAYAADAMRKIAEEEELAAGEAALVGTGQVNDLRNLPEEVGFDIPVDTLSGGRPRGGSTPKAAATSSSVSNTWQRDLISAIGNIKVDPQPVHLTLKLETPWGFTQKVISIVRNELRGMTERERRLPR